MENYYNKNSKIRICCPSPFGGQAEYPVPLSFQPTNPQVFVRGIKQVLDCCQSREYQIIFSQLRSGIFGAAAISSQSVLVFHENICVGGFLVFIIGAHGAKIRFESHGDILMPRDEWSAFM